MALPDTETTGRIERIIRETPALIPRYVDQERRYVAPSRTEFRVEHTIHRYSDGTASCSCKGFGFNGHCRHLDLLEYAITQRLTRDVLEVKHPLTDAEIEARYPGFLRAPKIDVRTGAVVR